MTTSQSLPRGRHSIPRKTVLDNQRARLLEGVAKAISERGYGELSVAHITAEAGVSRATFYVLFESKRECVLSAHRQAFEQLTARIEGACDGLDEWDDKLAAGLGAGLRFVVESPRKAHLLVLESLGSDRKLADAVLAAHATLAGLLRSGRRFHPGARDLPEVTERALVGAVISVAADLLAAGKVESLIDLEPQLLELVSMPYRLEESFGAQTG
jgi:AcrR family transcriptional regulator